MCQIDERRGMQGLVAISRFVIGRNVGGGGVSALIGVRVNAGKTEITLLALVRTGTIQIQSPSYFEETIREGFTTAPDGYVFHAARRAPSRCLNARFR